MHIGERIGDYTIVSKLGEGGMSIVYLAEHATNGTKVVVKELKEQHQLNQQLVDRFLREAEILQSLRHPHLARVFDIVVQSNKHYIVQELLSGGSLADLIRDKKPYTEEEALRWCCDALRAMNYAHENGVVHRDLKPSNLMLDDQRRVRVIDFGIARAFGQERLTRTSDGSIGTLEYMSPEQILTPNQIDHLTDVYSMGIVLYELLSGDVPFSGPTPFSIQEKITRQPPPPLRQLGHGISPLGANDEGIHPELARIIAKAIDKRPERRFGGCADFALQLERHLANRTGGSRKSLRLTEHPVALAGAVAALLVLVALLAWWVTPRDTSPPPDKTVAENKAPVEASAQKAAEDARTKAAEDARTKAAEDARAKAAEDARTKAAEDARTKAAEDARTKAAEDARTKAAEDARAKAAEDARTKAAGDARTKAAEDARAKAVEDARVKAAEDARTKAAGDARTKAAEDARAKAVEDARVKAAEDARVKAVEDARVKAAEDARVKAAEDARVKAAEDARVKAAEDARVKAAEDARVKAAEDARVKAAADARTKAAADARAKATEDARVKAAEDARVKAAEDARVKAADDARAKAAEDARAKAAENARAKAAEDARAKAAEDARAAQFFATVKGNWTRSAEVYMGQSRVVTTDLLVIGDNCSGVLTRIVSTQERGFAGWKKVGNDTTSQFRIRCDPDGKVTGDMTAQLAPQGETLVLDSKTYKRP